MRYLQKLKAIEREIPKTDIADRIGITRRAVRRWFAPVGSPSYRSVVRTQPWIKGRITRLYGEVVKVNYRIFSTSNEFTQGKEKDSRTYFDFKVGCVNSDLPDSDFWEIIEAVRELKTDLPPPKYRGFEKRRVPIREFNLIEKDIGLVKDNRQKVNLLILKRSPKKIVQYGYRYPDKPSVYAGGETFVFTQRDLQDFKPIIEFRHYLTLDFDHVEASEVAQFRKKIEGEWGNTLQQEKTIRGYHLRGFTASPKPDLIFKLREQYDDKKRFLFDYYVKPLWYFHNVLFTIKKQWT